MPDSIDSCLRLLPQPQAARAVSARVAEEVKVQLAEPPTTIGWE